MNKRPPSKAAPPSGRWRHRVLVHSIASLAIVATLPVLAATNIFQGGSWSSAADWTLNHTPASSDALWLNDPALSDSWFNGSFTAQTLSFDTGADSFKLDANSASAATQTLTLTGGTNANGGTDLLSLSANTTGTITLGSTTGLGTLNLAFGNTNGTINVANSAANLIFGANAHITGTNGITKNGAGTLQLLSANSYTGGTTINFGTITFANGALGTGTITLNGGGLRWATGNTKNISPQLGPIGFGGGTLDTNGNNVTFTAPLLGSGTVNKIGAGTLALAATGSTANITLTAGTLALGDPAALGTGTFTFNGGTLSFGSLTSASAGGLAGSAPLSLVNSNSQPVNFTVGSNGASTTYSGALSGPGGSAFTMAGPGTLTLSDALSGFAGTLNINQGVVALTNANVSFPGAVVLGPGSLAFGNNTTSALFGGVVSANAAAVLFTQTGLSTPVAVTLGGSNGNFGYAGLIIGNGSLTKIGSGSLTLSGNNIGFTGGLTLSSGTLLISSSNALGAGTFTVNGGTTQFQGLTNFTAGALAGTAGLSLVNTSSQPVTLTVGGSGASTTYSGSLTGFGTLVMNGTGTLTLTGTGSTANIQLQAGTIDLSANGSLGTGVFALNGGTLAFGTQTNASAGALAGTADLVLTNASNQGVTFTLANSNSSTTYSGAITGLGTLVINNTGTLNLSSANSTAGITLTNGTLNLGPTGGFGTGTFTYNGGVLNYGSQITFSAGALAGSANLPLTNNFSQPITFTVGGSGASTTYSGSLGAFGTLVKTGAGTLTLTGNQTPFTGTLNVAQGTVLFSVLQPTVSGSLNLTGGNVAFDQFINTATFGLLNGSSSTSTLSTQNAGGQPVTVTVGNSISTTFAGALTGNGTVNKVGTGTLALTNPNSTANITLSAGGLDISNNSFALGTGTFTYNGGTLFLGQQTNITAGGLAGSGTLSLAPSVTFNVGGNGAATTFSGSLTNNGTLNMNGPGTLALSGTGSTASIILTAGTIDLSGSSTGLGTGFFTLNGGNLTFGTLTSASAGTLAGSGNLVLTNASNQGVTFTVGNNFNTTYTGAVTGLGTLVKAGSGVLTLTNPNSTAGITLSAGALNIAGNPSALGSGTFTYTGGNLLAGSLTNITAGGLAGTANLPLQNQASQPLIFSVGSNGAATTFSGALTGSGTLLMNGPGTLALTGTGSTANITLASGTIDLSGSATGLGTGLFTLNGGSLNFGSLTSASAGPFAGSGNLVLTNASNQGVTFTVNIGIFPTTFSGAVTGLGALVKTGASTLTLTSSDSTAGITLNGGVINITNNSNALGSGTFTYNSGSLLTNGLTAISAGAFAGSGDFFLQNTFGQPLTFTVGSNGASTSYTGSFSGAGTLVKIGAGTMSLSGASTVANITLAGGALDISANGGALGTGVFTLNGGALTFGALTAASAGELAGSGGLVLTNASNAGVTFTVGSNNIPTTYTGAITGLGTLVKAGAGNLSLGGSNSTANITLSAGTLNIGTNSTALGSGTFTINGGTLSFGPQTSVSAGGLAGTASFPLTNGFGQPVAFTFGGNNQSTTYTGTIQGFGSLIKVGAGIFTPTQANTYGGGTTINGGTIVTSDVGSSSSVLGSGSVSVGPAGLLTGTGIILGNTFVSGTLAPGNPVGSMSFGSGLTLLSTAQYQVTLGGSTAGTYSQAFVQNSLSLGGNLSINFANGFVPSVGQVFTILNTVNSSNPVSGQFANANGANQITFNGVSFVVNYAGGDGNDVALTYLGSAGSGFFTWSGLGANTNWSTAANWLGGSAPQANNTGTQLIFAGPGTGAFLAPKNDTSFFVTNSISFFAGTGDFVLSGPAISLGSGGIVSTRLGMETIGNDISIASNQTWSIGTGSTVVVTGTISAIGTPALTKTGAGTLVLAGANTYNGGTTISGGTLQLGNGSAIGRLPIFAPITDNANLTFNSSSDMIQGTDFGPISGTGSVTQAGTGTVLLQSSNTYSGGTFINSGFVTFTSTSFGTGPITLNGGGLRWASGLLLDISSQFAPIGAAGGTLDTNGGDIQLSSALSGTGRLTKIGNGVLTVTGNNTAYSGGFAVTGGGLNIGSPNALGTGTLLVNSSGTLGFSFITNPTAGALAGTGNIVLTTNNSLPVSFSVGSNGASTTYSGTLSGLGTLIMNGTGTLTLGGDSSGSSSNVSIAAGTVALGTPNAAAGYVLGLNGGTLSFGALTSASAGGLKGAGSVQLVNSNGQAVTLTIGGNNASSTLDGNITGAGKLVKTGTGTFKLTSSASTAAITLVGGTLDISTGSLGSGTFTINSGAVNFGPQFTPSAGALAGSGNLVLATVSNQPLNFTVGSNGASTTYTGTLSGPGTLIMNGAGTLTLGGDSTGSSSNVTLTQGTVALGTPNAAAGYNLNLNGGTLAFSTLTSAAAGMLTGNGTLTLGNTNNQSVTLTVGGGNFSGAFNGTINGPGTLVKTGTGTLTFSNAIATTGLTLAAGTLDLGNNVNGLSSATLTVNGGTLKFGQANNYTVGALAGSGALALTNINSQPVILSVGSNGSSTTYTGKLSGLGQLVMNGSGTLTLGGDSTGSSSQVVATSGTLALATANALAGYLLNLNGGALSFGSLTNASAGGLSGAAGLVLTNTNSKAVTFSVGGNNGPSNFTGAITGAGTLVKVGTGTLTLSNSNSTAAITLAFGALTLQGSNALGSGLFTLNGGTLNTSGPANLGTGTFTINGGSVNFGSQTQATVGALAGSGNLVLTNSNNQSVFFTTGTSGASTTYTGILSGLGSLLVNGPGTLTLGGDSTGSTSNVALLQGTLVLGTPLAAAGYTLGFNGGGFSFGTLTKASAGALTGPGGVTLTNVNNQPVAFIVGGNNASTTYNGTLTGLGSLIKSGSGTLTLVTPGSTASIILNSGAISITNNNALGSGNFTLNGGSLNLNGITLPGSGIFAINGGSLNFGTQNNVQFAGLAGTGNLVLTNSNDEGVSFVINNSSALSTTFAGTVTGLGTLVLNSPGSLALTGNGSTAGIMVNQGTLDLSANGNALGTGLLTFNSGSLVFGSQITTSAGGLAGIGHITLTNANNQAVTFTVGGNNASSTFQGSLSGLGTLTKIGNGKLTLTQPNSYSGGTNINAGTVVVTSIGASSVLSTGPVHVGISGTIAGTGSVNGATVVDGVAAPGDPDGNPFGQLVFNNSLSLTSSGKFQFELTGTTPGLEYDQIYSNAPVSLAGNLEVILYFGYLPAVGTKFYILDERASGVRITGAFANVTPTGGATGIYDFAGARFAVNYADNNPQDLDGVANDVSITYLGIPEPSSLTSLLGGVLVLGWRRARRR